jgi:adenosylhomocysteine/aminodeoxyfutalosine nucleosidase
MLAAMLLIAAALMEELETALGLCTDRTRVSFAGAHLWQAVSNGALIRFLKTGVGPQRSATVLERVLRFFRPTSILVVGYAGALSPHLKLGDLVVIRRAALLGGKGTVKTDLDEVDLSESWDLDETPFLLKTAESAGIPAHPCDGLTSSHIIGEPVQKSFLHGRFGASVIDMETAALARLAASSGIPLGCVRAVSDVADDTFLAPFSYDPDCTPVRRAARVLAAGNWIRRYGEWRDRASVARDNLRRFLVCCLSRLSRRC